MNIRSLEVTFYVLIFGTNEDAVCLSPIRIISALIEKMTTPNNKYECHGLVLNSETRQVLVNNKILILTSVEFDVLKTLMENIGKIVSRESLTETVLRRTLSMHDRSVDVHVSRIRQKLNAAASLGHIVQSVRGVGYQLVSDIGYQK